MLLSRRGPIFLALVTTTRKVFTVLLSIFTSDAILAKTEVVGILIVISGLLLEGLSSVLFKSSKQAKANSAPHHPGQNTAASNGAEKTGHSEEKKHK